MKKKPQISYNKLYVVFFFFLLLPTTPIVLNAINEPLIGASRTYTRRSHDEYIGFDRTVHIIAISKNPLLLCSFD